MCYQVAYPSLYKSNIVCYYECKFWEFLHMGENQVEVIVLYLKSNHNN